MTITCHECNATIPMEACGIQRPYCAAPLSWLKRIPPLTDLDGKKDAADKPITLDGEIERLRKMVQA